MFSFDVLSYHVNMKKVLMVVVIMMLVASGVYFGYSHGVNKNDNNHNTSEESKKIKQMKIMIFQLMI